MKTHNFEYKGIVYNLIFEQENDFSKLKPIRQSYGVCFDDKGKIVIINTNGEWQLPGGTPEKNETPEETLIREVDEEADIDIKEIRPIGDQKVINTKTGETFYQLRYFALISKIKPSTIDPATGNVPIRKFISTDEFLEYCPWGEIGKEIMKVAQEMFDKR